MSRYLTLAAASLLLFACLLGSSPADQAMSPQSWHFARALDDAFEVLVEQSVFRPRRADLVRWAVEALARQAGTELPSDLDQHCRRVAELPRPEQLTFLCAVHARFCSPGRMDAQAVLDAVMRDVLRRTDPYA